MQRLLASRFLILGTILVCCTGLYAQTADTVILTSTSGTWFPKPGTKSFFVQMWGGGAGGNTGWPDGVNGYNGTGGGNGGTFSQTREFLPTATDFQFGFAYTVGTGGGINQNGTNTWFWNAGIAALGGVSRNQTQSKAALNAVILVSHFGGVGGQSFRYFTGDRWQGGGGGSAYTNGNGNGGGNAPDNVFNKAHGTGGDGTGRGGMTNNYNPATPGGGGSGDQNGARGEIRIYAVCDYSPGTIGNPHTVPFPGERPTGTNFITSTQNPVGLGFTISWERSFDQQTWTTIPGANQLTYAIPDTLRRTTFFRRVVNGCNPNPAANRSNVVRIRVFNPVAADPNDRLKNGRIRGRVVSVNGQTGVPGIEIRVQKTVNLLGSPQTHLYLDTTDADGRYDLQNLFYGDASNGDGTSVSFTVRPVKAGHKFGGPGSNTSGVGTVALDFNNPIVDVLNFIDSTVYLISGRVTQTCANCIPGTPTTFGVPGVRLSVTPIGLSPAFTDSMRVDSIGFYDLVVSNPGTYTWTPSYFGQSFVPGSLTQSVFANLVNQNFSDTSTRRISGRLTDGANLAIGTGSLLFEGVLERKDLPDIITFRLRATVGSDGSYSLRVPASYKYRVSVESFTPAVPASDPRHVREDSVINFFRRWAPQPLIDVREKDSVRNLQYRRPPVIVIAGGLRDTACNANATLNPGIVFRTNQRRFFQINVFEGPASLGQRVPISALNQRADTLADYLRIFTNVHKRRSVENADTLFYRLRNVGAGANMLDSSILPGAPEDIAPYTKPFELYYIDRFGRRAEPLRPKSTVVGSFNPTATFTTASPEKVTMILHAPPGDASSSYWEQNSSITTTRGWSVGSGDGLGGFISASLGPTVGIEDPISGIGFDIEIIAQGSFTQNKQVRHNLRDEFVETTRTSRRFEVFNSQQFEDGISNDLYIGNSTNFLMGKSVAIDFADVSGTGGCVIEKDVKPYLATQGFATEFFYTELQIKKVIIPQLISLRDAATTEAQRDKHQNQIDVWRQTMELNRLNKQQAAMIKNISFSAGASVAESNTFGKSQTNTITYDVEVTQDFAAEFGFRAAGVGISGGPLISIQETWGNDTTTTNESETTVGFVLNDDDPGDFFSVDVKRDRVYGTHVFDLVAGTASCAPENGAQQRDLPQILSGDMRFENLDPNGEHFFTLRLANRSESDETRPYWLSAGGGTGSGLIIESDGVNIRGTSIQIFIPAGGVLDVPIRVAKFNRNDGVVSYPDVEFYFSDDCKLNNIRVPNSISTAKVSFTYANACGNIRLRTPLQGWRVSAANNNQLPIVAADYTLANVDSIRLEYKSLRANSQWTTGFSVARSLITADTFARNWNVAGLPDTAYEIRLRLRCSNGTIIFSNSAFGIIDRAAPALVGRPMPANRLYDPLTDEISFAYNEPISIAGLQPGSVELVSFTNGVMTVLPISVVPIGNRLVVVPSAPIPQAADSFRVSARNIADEAGNVNTTSYVGWFTLNRLASLPYTGPNIATVSISPSSISAGSNGRMEIRFRLRERTQRPTRVFFNLAGTGIQGTNYRLSYDTIQRSICRNPPSCTLVSTLPVLNDFSVLPAYAHIDSNQQEVVVFLTPVQESFTSGSRTVQVSIVPGATYRTGTDSASATATILAVATPVLYVNAQATGTGSGLSWQNAFTRLEQALNSTQPGVSQVWVARGTYRPTANTNRDSAFVMRNNLAIYGGFAGGETTLSQRNWRVNQTILSGDIGVSGNRADNSFNVVRNNNNALNSTAVLDGFTITGGNANKGDYVGNRGGGIFNRLSSPTIANCILTGNNAVEYGGGVFNEGASTQIVNTVLAGNTAAFGGGAYNESSTPVFINCTFAGNQVTGIGGGFYSFGSPVPIIRNSILWGNSSGIGVNASVPAVSNSIVQGGYAAGTNISTADPVFMIQPAIGLANLGDLRLQACSPAINAGVNAVLPAAFSNSDLAGANRIVGANVDLGAYERQALSLPTTIYVDANATGTNDGTSWANAYTTLQAALSDLNLCAIGSAPTVLVARGTYQSPSAGALWRVDKVGAVILGGYPNGGGVTRNVIANPVVFRGEFRVLKNARLDGVRIEPF